MSSTIIHNIVTLVPQEGKVSELIEWFESFSQYVQTHEPKTLRYYAVQPKSGDKLIIVEKYANEEAVKAHAQSVAFKEFWKRVTGIMQLPPDIQTSTIATGFETRPGM